MRACQKRNPDLPGPDIMDGWICTFCGNKNFPDRTECNMNRCRQPRPGYRVVDIRARSSPYSSVRPESDWICECGNKNFASRQVCNMRKCGMPRPPSRQGSPFGSDFRDSRRDSAEWTCQCGNVNYSDRAFCNMRKCGLPRECTERRFSLRRQVYVNPSPYMREAPRYDRPPIDRPPIYSAPNKRWFCECGNENYEDRLHCNMRKCGLPKPTLGGKTALINNGWLCVCGNVNFAEREMCNMRKCGLARPDCDDPPPDDLPFVAD